MCWGVIYKNLYFYVVLGCWLCCDVGLWCFDEIGMFTGAADTFWMVTTFSGFSLVTIQKMVCNSGEELIFTRNRQNNFPQIQLFSSAVYIFLGHMMYIYPRNLVFFSLNNSHSQKVLSIFPVFTPQSCSNIQVQAQKAVFIEKLAVMHC